MKLSKIKIIRIKKIGKRKVYDLSVNKNHNFFLSNKVLSHNCLDTQSPNETRGICGGSEDFLLLFRLTGFRDKSEVCDELKREHRIRPDQVASLALLDKGQAYVVESGKNAKRVQIRLPRSAYWKKEYGNFYKNVWEKFGGTWINIEETEDYIKDRIDELAAPIIKKPSYTENIVNEKVGKGVVEVTAEEEIVEPIRPKIRRSIFS